MAVVAAVVILFLPLIKNKLKLLTNLRKATSTGTGINFLLKEQIDTLTDAMSTNALNALGDEQARLESYGNLIQPRA
jgi:hypothetical protein